LFIINTTFDLISFAPELRCSGVYNLYPHYVFLFIYNNYRTDETEMRINFINVNRLTLTTVTPHQAIATSTLMSAARTQ